jgi:ribosome-interacting GTPase 1
MRPVSRKKAAVIRVYIKRRAEFLEHNPWCLRCGKTATEVHHKAGRIAGALLDDTRWAAVCADCHRYITEHPAEAIECGWSLPRVAS